VGSGFTDLWIAHGFCRAEIPEADDSGGPGSRPLAASTAGEEVIRHFERYVGGNAVVVRKFFLHISPDEHKKRFLERLENSTKDWKV